MKTVRRIILCACFLCAVSGTCTGTAKKTAPTGIYNPDPAHLWNQLHRALFVRSYGQDGIKYRQGTVDPLLWPNNRQFLLSGPSHEAVIDTLNEFLTSGGEKWVKGPRRRAILQHELWAVFDWTTNLDSAYRKANSAARTAKLDAARREIRKRMAAAMQRLTLDAKKIVRLPNNYAVAVASAKFSKTYGPKHPEQPFLPANLLDPKDEWTCVRCAAGGPSAPVHTNYYRGRSRFLVFIRLPGRKKAARHYLQALNESAVCTLQGWLDQSK